MIIHQIWLTPPGKDDLPAPHPPRRATMEKASEGNYKLWTHDDANMLVSKLGGKFEKVYNSLPHHICKCDVLRYFIMYVIGGAYFDCDFVCIKRLDLTFSAPKYIYLSEEWQRSVETGTVHNGALISPRGHPFWLAVIDEIILRNEKLSSDDIKDKGKSVFGLTGTSLLRDMALKNKNWVKILPFYTFCPHRAGEDEIPAWHDNSRFPHPLRFEPGTSSYETLKKSYPLSFTVPIASDRSWQLSFD